MKIFIDTANIEEIKEVNSWGILDGVTTNPTLVCKEKRNFEVCVKEIASIVKGPISAEAVSMDKDGIVKEARELSKLAPNIVVKVPVTEEGLKATKVLSSEGVKVNMTLVFSVNQAVLAAKAGASFVSPFLGRLDDVGHDGMSLLFDIITVYDNYGVPTEVIAASIRHPLHVICAAQIGVDIVTCPYKVLRAMVKHPLTDRGIDRFLEDWKKIEDL